jgi:hypothetical protein
LQRQQGNSSWGQPQHHQRGEALTTLQDQLGRHYRPPSCHP